MSEQQKTTTAPPTTGKKRISALPITIAVGILLMFTVFFIVEFVQLSNEERHGAADDALTADTYMAVVAPLLAQADPERGRELVELWGCNVCHAGANAGRLAPAHAEAALMAAQRRPPLSAAAYIYESIVYPGAFVVPGYQNNMPRIYEQQMPEDELGDIIAYLLLPPDEDE